MKKLEIKINEEKNEVTFQFNFSINNLAQLMAEQAMDFTHEDPELYTQKLFNYCKDKLIRDEGFRDKYLSLIKKDLLNGNMPLDMDYLNDVIDAEKVNSLVKKSYKKSN